jgi:hypothetical protein
MSSGTCAVAAGALSLFLMVAAFAVLTSADSEWNIHVFNWRLPNPGDFSSWVRPGSPMDCLLTSQESRLSIDLGYRYVFWSRDSTVDIVVGRTTMVAGDGLEALEPYMPVRFFRTAGLPRALGLLYYLDFIGASQRPESELLCRGNGDWRSVWHIVTLSFWCDGVPRGSLYFETSCNMLLSRVPHQPAYLRALGIIDVARAVAANRRRSKNSPLSSPATVRSQ